MLSAHHSFLIAVNVGVFAGVLALTTPQASLFSPAGRIGLTGTPGGWAPKSVVLQADNGRGGEEPEGIPRPDPPAPMVVTDGTQPADRLSPTLLLRIVGLGLVTLKVDEPRRLTSPPAVDPASSSQVRLGDLGLVTLRVDDRGWLTGAPAEDAAASSRMGSDDGGGTPYIFSRRDNICGKGVKNPASITRPATVNYKALLAATDEARKIKKDRIDLHSAEGLKLMTGAKRKVLKACEAVRRANNHCGVWKKITRRDGRRIADITAGVWRAMRAMPWGR
jgi:hypothetical protein